MWPWEIKCNPQEPGKATMGLLSNMWHILSPSKEGTLTCPITRMLQRTLFGQHIKVLSANPSPCQGYTQARIWLAGKYRNQQVLFTPCSKKISWLVPSLEFDLFMSYNTWLILNLEVLWGYRDKVHSTRNHQHSQRQVPWTRAFYFAVEEFYTFRAEIKHLRGLGAHPKAGCFKKKSTQE